MIIRLFCFSTILLFSSCKQREISQIEIIKFDKNLIDSLIKSSDTMYSSFIGRHDFYSEDFYIKKEDSLITQIIKDSLGNVVALGKTKNGVTFFAAEYYTNGQMIGKTKFRPGTVDGPATYYYPDGRIKSKGQWSNYAQVGTWKIYKENGELKATDYYDSNGNLLKTDSIK